MSSETYAALEAALHAHVADDEVSSMFIAQGRQSAYMSTGMLYTALNVRDAS